MINNNQSNGFKIMLNELQADFNNALKIKDYCTMNEIITEAYRIKNDTIGGFIFDLSKKFYFTELSEKNTIKIPPEVVKPLKITPDTRLLVYMNTKQKYIIVDPDQWLTPELAKDVADDIKLSEYSKVRANGELPINLAMINCMGAKTGDIIIITFEDDTFEIKKYSDDDFLWNLVMV